MSKHALLVGCTYVGSRNPLPGCYVDVMSMYHLLQDAFGFSQDDITVLLEKPDGSTYFSRPTGFAIRRALMDLARTTQSGDSVVFYFSGHGTQIPDLDGDEEDGKDEALVGCDENLVTDDELRLFLSWLPPGVKFTMISDCCHSGDLLDHGQACLGGDKSLDQFNLPQEVLYGILDKEDPVIHAVDPETKAMLAAAVGSQGSRGKSLSAEEYAWELSQQLGHQVAVEDIRTALAELFGDQAPGHWGDDMEGLTAKGDHDTHQDRDQEVYNGVPLQFLISGCQSHELSQEAPTAAGVSAGRMTQALVKSVRLLHDHTDQRITYMLLVLMRRAYLEAHGVLQNPCLDCAEEVADSVFIVSGATGEAAGGHTTRGYQGHGQEYEKGYDQGHGQEDYQGEEDEGPAPEQWQEGQGYQEHTGHEQCQYEY